MFKKEEAKSFKVILLVVGVVVAVISAIAGFMKCKKRKGHKCNGVCGHESNGLYELTAEEIDAILEEDEEEYYEDEESEELLS